MSPLGETLAVTPVLPDEEFIASAKSRTFASRPSIIPKSTVAETVIASSFLPKIEKVTVSENA